MYFVDYKKNLNCSMRVNNRFKSRLTRLMQSQEMNEEFTQYIPTFYQMFTVSMQVKVL